MVKFNSSYLESAVKEELKIFDRPITQNDLSNINGIIFAYESMRGIPVPWYSESQAHQMHIPNLFLSTMKLFENKNWEEDMKLFTHIRSIYSYVDGFKTNFLHLFPNLSELYLYGAVVTDWSFLSKLANLKSISIRKCGKDGNMVIKRLGELYESQYSRFKSMKDSGVQVKDLLGIPMLDNINISYADISDLSPLQNIEHLTELNLSHNIIKHLTPLAKTKIYYLILRHNLIEDIEPLSNMNSYLMNLRHNCIKTMNPIMDKKRHPYLSRLFIGHNDIPEEELQELRQSRWIQCDFKQF